MTVKYAAGTDVPVSRSRQHIDDVLRKYGCNSVMQGFDTKSSFVAFIHKNLQVRIVIPMPESAAQQRQRMRVLLLCIKAKFEFVASGARSFEEEFLTDIVMPNGDTVGQSALPSLRKAITDNRMPTKLLPL